jgi:1,4-dihydroxy-2-naphthoate octaprenyltransferase
MTEAAAFRPRAFAWILAARPGTLSLSLSPVAAGAAIAWAETHRLRWPAVLVAGLAAALIQIGTNLHNDAADFRRGGDGPARLGPARATASGLLSAEDVSRGALVCFAVAAAAGFYLAAVGGWPILLIGLVSIACGLAYSSGPCPIAYTPFGELFVLAFFGLAAVGGVGWLACGRIGLASLVAGAALGLFAAAVLLVNNHRDRVEDARVGRHTLAIAIGPEASRWLYASLMLSPFALLVPLARLLPDANVAPALLSLPLALLAVVRFFREPAGPGLNAQLGLTAHVQLAFALLICIGAVA